MPDTRKQRLKREIATINQKLANPYLTELSRFLLTMQKAQYQQLLLEMIS